MSKPSVITPRKLVTILKNLGFQLDHTTGSHFIFYSTANQEKGSCSLSPKRFTKRNLNEYPKRSGG